MQLVLRADINKSRKFSRWKLFTNTWVVMLLARYPIQMDQSERRLNVVAVHITSLLGKPNSLTWFFLGFGKFVGEERAICIVTSDLEAIKCASFNIFMKGATHWYKTQINNTLEADKIYFKLGSNLHVFREITKFPYILLYESCYLCSI